MTTKRQQKRVYITWFSFSSRSDSMAHYLGARSFQIRYFKRRRIIYAPLKYVLGSFKTLVLLHKERPDVIFVANPPVFAVLAVWFYCLLHKSKYVVDSHSATFTDTRWASFLWLYRFLAKRALTNMLHNEPLRERVAGWGAPAMTLVDGPPVLKTDQVYPFRNGFNVVLVSSYHGDEPVLEVIEAARKATAVNFYITGSLKHAPKAILTNIPDNVVLTDYLPERDYAALLKGCDVVMSLTIDDFKMQCGAHEALEFGRPIITSDFPILREFFSKGTIHVDNTASSLIKAIERIRMNHSDYLKEIEILREQRNSDWQNKFSKLLKLLDEQ